MIESKIITNTKFQIYEAFVKLDPKYLDYCIEEF